MSEPARDQWAEWLLHRRHGGDPEALQRTLAFLSPVRDRVLANAQIAPGETVLDVGAGDGLIAFGAVERVGPTGQVILSDVSQDLLDHTQALATQLGVLTRCRFVRAAAEDLAPISDASVDVVTTRSVLIYVKEKQRAFIEFARVLRPGGRISLFEPINRFGFGQSAPGLEPIQELVAKVRAVYARYQSPETDPMMDFDERDLLVSAEQAGFREIHLELQASVAPGEPQRWESVLRTSGNPKLPTLDEVLGEALTAEERVCYEAVLRVRIEQGQVIHRSAVTYLWARK